MEKAIKRYFPIFVLPTMIAFTLGFIIPFAEGVYLSFCKFTTVNDAKFIGLSNYGKVFKDSTFVHAFWYTAAFTVVSVILINVLQRAVAVRGREPLRRDGVGRHGEELLKLRLPEDAPHLEEEDGQRSDSLAFQHDGGVLPAAILLDVVDNRYNPFSNF